MAREETVEAKSELIARGEGDYGRSLTDLLAFPWPSNYRHGYGRGRPGFFREVMRNDF